MPVLDHTIQSNNGMFQLEFCLHPKPLYQIVVGNSIQWNTILVKVVLPVIGLPILDSINSLVSVFYPDKSGLLINRVFLICLLFCTERDHPRLCSLCKDAMFACGENDMFAGPDGSVKCLVEGRGEVAFTTIDTAVQYFARRPEERDQYELLCLDGSRMPITTRGCDWAKHPTNTFVIRKGRGTVLVLMGRF